MRGANRLLLALAVVLMVAIVAVAVARSPEVSVVKLHGGEPFQTWTDAADVPTPPVVEVSQTNCPGGGGTGLCVKPDTSLMHFPKRHMDREGIRLAYWHELGHVFQLTYNAEVQGGWPQVDDGCDGTFSFYCAERFANAYRNCAADDRQAHLRDPFRFDHNYYPTAAEHAAACAFIQGVP